MQRKYLRGIAATAVGAIGTVAAALLWCGPAYAQGEADGQHADSVGIRFGNFELHPGATVRGGYETNVFKTNSNATGTGILMAGPSLTLSTIGKTRQQEGNSSKATPPTIALKLGTALNYLYYFNDAVRSRMGSVPLEPQFDGLLTILPERPVNVELGGTYERHVRPSSGETSRGQTYDQNLISPMIKLNAGTNGGVLASYVSYSPHIEIYEADSAYSELNNISHTATQGASWRFLPHTALLQDLEVAVQDYFEDSLGAQVPIQKSDSTRLKGRFGINGALTETFSGRIMAGYTAGFFPDDSGLDEYEGPIGEISALWKPDKNLALSAGYARNVMGSHVGGAITEDRIFAKAETTIAQRVSIAANASVGFMAYGDLRSSADCPDQVDTNGDLAPDTDHPALSQGLLPIELRGLPNCPLGVGGETSRDDTKLDLSLEADYKVLGWLSLIASAAYAQVITDFEYWSTLVTVDSAGDPQSPPPVPAGYANAQVYGGVRFSY